MEEINLLIQANFSNCPDYHSARLQGISPVVTGQEIHTNGSSGLCPREIPSKLGPFQVRGATHQKLGYGVLGGCWGNVDILL